MVDTTPSSADQQRCWVHLIRDLNDDIREHPFDKEYEAFVLEVRDLILPIMETVQRYGLKKRHLHKFMKQVDDFYARVITDKQYKSDLVCTYQKRFIRYRNSLFTFLEQDDIPWNNNAAEKSSSDPLRYKGTFLETHSMHPHFVPIWSYWAFAKPADSKTKSFFKFLFSEEVDLDNFSARTHKR